MRSGLAVFCYDTKCLFCRKIIQEHIFKAESQMPEKHLAYKIRSHFAKQQFKAKCLEMKGIWGNEILVRIEYSIDVMQLILPKL